MIRRQIMARTRYLLMKESSVTNGNGVTYPDPITFPIKKLVITEDPLEYTIRDLDLDRFDLVMYRYYGTSYYDDVILWYNEIGHLSELESGDTILLPSSGDIENFFLRNR